MRTTLILAAGKGTRMGDQVLPKCLLPYRGNAILGNLIDQLELHRGEREVVIAIPEKDDHIMNFTASAYPGYAFTFIKVPDYVTPRGPIGTTEYCLRQFKELPKTLTITVADCIFSPVFVTENVSLGSVLFVAHRTTLKTS
jgi:choline kinase